MRSFIFLLFLTFLTPVFCQTTEKNNDFWISGGLGFYKNGNYDGVSLYSSLNLTLIKPAGPNNRTHYKKNNFEFRFIYNTASINEDNFEYLKEVGLLYGKSFGKSIQLTIAGGLGVLKGYQETDYQTWNATRGVFTNYVQKNISTLGIPFELGVNLIPGKHFGLGIDWYADLNSKSTISGYMIKLLLGNIR